MFDGRPVRSFYGDEHGLPEYKKMMANYFETRWSRPKATPSSDNSLCGGGGSGDDVLCGPPSTHSSDELVPCDNEFLWPPEAMQGYRMRFVLAVPTSPSTPTPPTWGFARPEAVLVFCWPDDPGLAVQFIHCITHGHSLLEVPVVAVLLRCASLWLDSEQIVEAMRALMGAGAGDVVMQSLEAQEVAVNIVMALCRVQDRNDVAAEHGLELQRASGGARGVGDDDDRLDASSTQWDL